MTFKTQDRLPDTQGNRNGMYAHIQMLTATGGDRAEREWKRLFGLEPPWLSALGAARFPWEGMSYAVYPLRDLALAWLSSRYSARTASVGMLLTCSTAFLIRTRTPPQR